MLGNVLQNYEHSANKTKSTTFFDAFPDFPLDLRIQDFDQKRYQENGPVMFENSLGSPYKPLFENPLEGLSRHSVSTDG